MITSKKSILGFAAPLTLLWVLASTAHAATTRHRRRGRHHLVLDLAGDDVQARSERELEVVDDGEISDA